MCMLYVPPACLVLATYPGCMSSKWKPGCPCCMSLLHPRCLSMLLVHTACPRCLSMLLVHAPCRDSQWFKHYTTRELFEWFEIQGISKKPPWGCKPWAVETPWPVLQALVRRNLSILEKLLCACTTIDSVFPIACTNWESQLLSASTTGESLNFKSLKHL
jgi:hypothetical protein